MRLAALFTAFVSASTCTVLDAFSRAQAGLLFKNPADAETFFLGAYQLNTERGIKNPIKPPSRDFDILNPWSGGVIKRAPRHSRFTYVSARLVVPIAKVPTDAPPDVSYFGLCVWVGINGFSSDTLLQAGIYMILDKAGKVAIKAFYQWLPQDQYSLYVEELIVSPGDKLSLCVKTSVDGTESSMYIKNETTRKYWYSGIRLAAPGSELSAHSAEWIVERFTKANGDYSTPFDAVFTFTDAFARAADDNVYGPHHGTVANFSPKLLPRVDPYQVTVSYYYNPPAAAP